MNTKYIQYKSKLLISLLSLSSLSSCTYAGKKLGMGGGNSKDGANNSSPFRSACKDSANDVKNKLIIAGTGALVGAAFGAAVGYGAGAYSKDCGSSNSSSYNASSSTGFGKNSTDPWKSHDVSWESKK